MAEQKSYRELVLNQGLEAAKEAFEARRETLAAKQEQLEYQLQQTNKELLAMEGEFRRQVRDALGEVGFTLKTPQDGSKKSGAASGRRSSEETLDDRRRLLAALPDSEDEAMGRTDWAATAARENDATFQGDMLALKKAGVVETVGSGPGTRYYRTAEPEEFER